MENQTEYEWIRSLAEGEAIRDGSINAPQINHIRSSGSMILKSLGLTPEKVWDMTRNMRRIGNGGMR